MKQLSVLHFTNKINIINGNQKILNNKLKAKHSHFLITSTRHDETHNTTNSKWQGAVAATEKAGKEGGNKQGLRRESSDQRQWATNGSWADVPTKTKCHKVTKRVRSQSRGKEKSGTNRNPCHPGGSSQKGDQDEGNESHAY